MRETEESTRITGFAKGIRLAAAVSGALYASLALLGVAGDALPEWMLIDGNLTGAWGKAETAIVAAFVVCGMRELIEMMRAVERGSVFTPGTISHLRRFAAYIALSALAGPTLALLTQIWVVAANSRGVISLTVDNSTFLLLFVCAVIALVARVLELGAEYAADSESIV